MDDIINLIVEDYFIRNKFEHKNINFLFVFSIFA